MRGRDLQRHFGQPQQSILMMPIIEGLDGVQKMSKSLGNAIGINEPASENVREADVDLRRTDVEVLGLFDRRAWQPRLRSGKKRLQAGRCIRWK